MIENPYYTPEVHGPYELFSWEASSWRREASSATSTSLTRLAESDGVEVAAR